MTYTIPATDPATHDLALDPGYMDEPFRPQYHYTAEKNMINDPNGLLWYDGEYHLFHQYNLHDAIHWGHAVSTDLVHWTHLPPAIFPDRIGQIYSGTAVVDTANTSGFQQGEEAVMVAAFTYAEHQGPQSQGIAYSNDRGRTWTMYEGNPVIPNPGKPDFRDPKILWHEPTDRWIMVLTAGTHLDFYTSPDLKTWTFSSEWGRLDGSHGGEWECPDLFELQVEGTDETRWVLSVSIGRGAPAGGSGMQYFVGHFDGVTFRNSNTPDLALWQNYGQDYYAGITWANVPPSDGRRLMIAWADNWMYRFDVPTTPFNGQLSLVHELTLKTFPEGIRLVHSPVAEQDLLRDPGFTWENIGVPEGRSALPGPQGECLEIIAEFDLAATSAHLFGIDVRTGSSQLTRIGFDANTREVFVDRHLSGTKPSMYWIGRNSVPFQPAADTLTLRIFVDRSSVEVFVDGREVISLLILPDAGSTGTGSYSEGGTALLKSLQVHPVRRIWPERSPAQTPTAAWSTFSGEWAETCAGRQGSSRSTGMCLRMDGRSAAIETKVTIIGARDGNPQSILGQHAAGLIVRADEQAGTGYAAVINVRDSILELLKINSSASTEILASARINATTNEPVHLQLTTTGTKIVAATNNTVITAQDTSFASGRSGLYVQDAEALYTAVKTS
ncbi:fructan beta-fructosidase [Arthrobacter sp. SLBN-100]|uniref:glycoside hydrolase family 32 protein n=1 Tax=Arthrobacter sp. SLBN-100 TaxID=2768450 RepID=UPI00116E9E46|nr:glycoside hydrolase family 32 protein [Arthrobacter sp. SLBN-100]TQJ62052.1 fructan beta-fructosidase [Arthrobacter sp. SLBN-100]